ncbi:uncharacterized protein LOC123943692 [Meles meles]|uniref:uncharacterized protein LOC123943692 n=1 Tax=Meles meles TaxID=9662 RepID=UPI001E69D5D8|nr:uncharacterized protein LOC123943692 [Meles meles]
MCVEAFRGAGQLPNSVGPSSTRPPSQRPSDSSLRPAPGRRLVLRGGGAGKCPDLGSPKLGASPASPWSALPFGRSLLVRPRRGRDFSGAAVAECRGHRRLRPGEGESLPVAAATVARATVRERGWRSQLPGKDPPPGSQRDPAGAGVDAPPRAEVLLSGFRDPSGPLCRLSFPLDQWLQQVKTQRGRWGALECSPLSLSPSLAISLLSAQGFGAAQSGISPPGGKPAWSQPFSASWQCPSPRWGSRTLDKMIRPVWLPQPPVQEPPLHLPSLSPGWNTSLPWTRPFLPTAPPVLTCPGGQQRESGSKAQRPGPVGLAGCALGSPEWALGLFPKPPAPRDQGDGC